MRNLVLSGVSALAIAVATGGAAGAADLYEPPAAVAAAGPYDWTGAYIGVHLGYGQQETQFYTDNETSPGSCSGPAGAFCNIGGDGESAVFGAQAGINFQNGNFVWGIEGDASWAGMEATAYDWCCTDRNSEIDTLASLRGRLGYAFDRVLVYATGGIGYVHGVAHKDTDSQFDGRVTVSSFDPVAGGGVAWAYNDRVSFRAEGLYFFVDDVATLSDDQSIHTENVWVARLGLDYKLF